MLRALQHEFCAYLLDRPSRIGEQALGDMDVYHHAYRAQLLHCLQDTFEKTWSWLGDEAFEAAARAHIEANPPISWTLNVYGLGFDRTLAGLHPEDPEIAELSWLEWHLRRAFDGPDADPLDTATLGAIDWDGAVLYPVPTLTLGAITSNCAAIWTALAEGNTPPPAERLPSPGAIRVWKQALSPKFRSVDAAEERALRRLLAGAGFAAICADLADEQEIGRILGLWLQDGLIAEISEDHLPMSR